MSDKSPPLGWRVVCAVAVGSLFGVLCHELLLAWGTDVQANDFTYPWIGVRALLHRQSPYVAVATARTPSGFGLFYPLPAVPIAVPFAWMSAHAAGVAFMFLSFAFLSFLLTKRAYWRLLVLASAPAYKRASAFNGLHCSSRSHCFRRCSGYQLPSPIFALPVPAFQSSRRAWYFAACRVATLLIMSFLAMPTWASEWLNVLRGDGAPGMYSIPIASPLGCATALAALRRRRHEARLRS